MSPVVQRSIVTILQGILEDLQEIIRAEVTLAKREIGDEIARGRSAAVQIAAGAAGALIGFHFLLWSAVYALALRLPFWAAAAIVGGTFLIAGGLMAWLGLQRWRRTSLMPDRTVATLKENVEWVKQLSK